MWPAGNKLFQGTFIKIINPDATLIQALEWTLLNSSVALVGYYFAAFTIDKPWMGRMRMQVVSVGRVQVLALCPPLPPCLLPGTSVLGPLTAS